MTERWKAPPRSPAPGPLTACRWNVRTCTCLGTARSRTGRCRLVRRLRAAGRAKRGCTASRSGRPASGPPPERPAARYARLHYDLGDLRETGAAVAMTTFRPSEDQAVLVVAAADSDAVEAHLRPQLGELLCVILSKWTKADLEAVGAHLLAHHDWNLYSWGDTSAEDGQAMITASL